MTKNNLFADADLAAAALVAAVADALNNAVATRGRASLALSGGKSPIPFLELLARADVPWSAVDVSLVDERWVPADHADSNAALVARHFLAKGASAARFVPLFSAQKSPIEQAASLSSAGPNAGMGVGEAIDVVMLGMGEDGHTASWFADSQELREALESLSAYVVMSATGARQMRITLTYTAVRAARHVFLSIAGEAKRRVLAQATQQGVGSGLPVSHLLELPQLRVFVG
jgi:6-phosphogluconolactonase